MHICFLEDRSVLRRAQLINTDRGHCRRYACASLGAVTISLKCTHTFADSLLRCAARVGMPDPIELMAVHTRARATALATSSGEFHCELRMQGVDVPPRRAVSSNQRAAHAHHVHVPCCRQPQRCAGATVLSRIRLRASLLRVVSVYCKCW